MSLEFAFLTRLLKYEIHHNKIPFFYCDLSSYLYDNIIQLAANAIPYAGKYMRWNIFAKGLFWSIREFKFSQITIILPPTSNFSSPQMTVVGHESMAEEGTLEDSASCGLGTEESHLK